MGRYERKDTHDIVDSVHGLYGAETKDKETGEIGRGAGWDQKEARDNSWKNLKSK